MTIIVFLIYTNAIYSQSDSTNLERLLNIKVKTNTKIYDAFLKNLNVRISEKELKLFFQRPSPKVPEETYTKLFEAQQKKDDVENLLHKGLSLGLDVSKERSQLPGTPSAIATGLLFFATDKLLEKRGEALIEAQNAEFKKLYEEYLNDDYYALRLNSDDFQQRKDALREIYEKDEFKHADIDESKRKTAKNSRLKFIENMNEALFNKLINDQQETNETLGDLTKQVDALSCSYRDFRTTTFEALSTLQDNQESLRKEFNKFKEDYGKDKIANDIVQEYVFGKMSTSEKIVSLRLGLLPNMDSTRKKILIKELELQEKKEKIYSGISDFFNSGQTTMKILNNLQIGKNAKVLSTIATGLGIGNTLFNAFKVFSSPFSVTGYLEGISMITGLFGMNRDIAGERHQQIMEAFNALNSRIENLESMTAQVLENQKIIIDNQRKTFEMLLEIYNRLSEGQQEILGKLQRVNSTVVSIKGIILDDKFAPIDNAQEFVDSLDSKLKNDTLGHYWSTLHRFLNTRAYKDYYNEAYDFFKNNKPFNSKNEIKTMYKLKTYKGENESEVDYFIKRFDENLDLFKSSKGTPVLEIMALKNSYSSLNFPSFTYKDLKSKLISKDLYVGSPTIILDTLNKFLPELLSPNTLIDPSHILNKLHPMFEMVTKEGDIMNTEDFIENANNGRLNFDFAKGLFRQYLNVINIAISQQNLISGDFLLEFSYEKFKDGRDNTVINKIYKVLENNVFFAQNFLIHYIKRSLEENNTNILQYGFALDQFNFTSNFKDLELMCNTLNIHNVVYKSKDSILSPGDTLKRGPYLVFNNKYYAFPEYNEVRDGILYHTDFMVPLLMTKRSLLDELYTYEIFDGINNDDYQNFNTLFLPRILSLKAMNQNN